MVHRPERLVEILDTMKKYNIQPKKDTIHLSKTRYGC